jgi:hypothetical protein
VKRTCYHHVNDALIERGVYPKRKISAQPDWCAKLCAVGGVKLEETSHLGIGFRQQHAKQEASVDESVVTGRSCPRVCGTPGCSLPDFHDGVCEPDRLPEGAARTRRGGASKAEWMPTGATGEDAIHIGERHQASEQPMLWPLSWKWFVPERPDRLVSESESCAQVRARSNERRTHLPAPGGASTSVCPSVAGALDAGSHACASSPVHAPCAGRAPRCRDGDPHEYFERRHSMRAQWPSDGARHANASPYSPFTLPPVAHLTSSHPPLCGASLALLRALPLSPNSQSRRRGRAGTHSQSSAARSYSATLASTGGWPQMRRRARRGTTLASVRALGDARHLVRSP